MNKHLALVLIAVSSLFALQACDEPKDWSFLYDECFPFLDEDEVFSYQYRFTAPLILNAGVLTVRGDVDPVNAGENLPDRFRLRFRHVRAKQTLVEFLDDIALNDKGGFGGIKVTFPGQVQFKKNDRFNFDFSSPNGPLVKSDWRFRAKFRMGDPQSYGSLLPNGKLPGMIITVERFEE